MSVYWQQEFTRLALDHFGHPLTLHYQHYTDIPGVRIWLAREPGLSPFPGLWGTIVPDEFAAAIDGSDPYWETASMDFARMLESAPA